LKYYPNCVSILYKKYCRAVLLTKGKEHFLQLYFFGKPPVSDFVVMGDTIEKVSKSSILTKVSILSILEKSIGNSIPLEPAMFLVSIPDQSLKTS
jgi:hypothetical protein